MAWKLLPTDYTDAVWSGLKRYTQVDNSDGTVSFNDVTTYTNKEKSFFGAKDANRMNEALNYIMSMLENGTNLYEDIAGSLQNQITEVDERLAALEHMTLKNLFTVPVAIDNTGTTLLADDLGNAIVADWKYKEE